MNLGKHLLENQFFALQAEAKDWKAAVQLGTNILEAAGFIRPTYYEEICNTVEKIGPYFLLAPGIAMPHARPECGVEQTGFALVTLKTPVCFGDAENDPIDILLTMASKDAKTQNEQSIVQVVELLDSEERVENIRKARSALDLQEIFGITSE